MRRVVERGQSRCPRCGILTDYTFVEYSAGMSYELRCHGCTYEYVELATPEPSRTGAVPELTTSA